MASTTRLISLLRKLRTELGIDSILNSSRDTKILCLQRFVRLFAYGASTLILAAYLSSLRISDTRIGLFMTLTLLGDVVISFGLTLFADGLGRRKILIAGASLMTASGIVFTLSSNYWVLVTASILGVISPRLEFFLSSYKHFFYCSLTIPSPSVHISLIYLVQWERNWPIQSYRGVHFGPTHSITYPERYICLVYVSGHGRFGRWDDSMRMDSGGTKISLWMVRYSCVPSYLWSLCAAWDFEACPLVDAQRCMRAGT